MVWAASPDRFASSPIFMAVLVSSRRGPPYGLERALSQGPKKASRRARARVLGAELIRQFRQILPEHIDRHGRAGLAGVGAVFVDAGGVAGAQSVRGRGFEVARMRGDHHAARRL